MHLNWALGLHALDCEVIWLEHVDAAIGGRRLRHHVDALKERLAPYGLAERVALCSSTDGAIPTGERGRCLDLEDAREADLLLNIRHDMPCDVVRLFRRSALLDIDPGLLQTWMSRGQVKVAPHDTYFTIGETVACGDPRIPNVGVRWRHTPPAVALDWWPVRSTVGDAAFTTVAHWFASAAIEAPWDVDDKRSGFLPILDLPRRTPQRLELALSLGRDSDERVVKERAALVAHGWDVRNARDVASTPWAYQHYIQASRGELSGAKPSYLRLQTAWISDRTVCYLASGKPALVQHTGPSRFLPDAAGLFRFRTVQEAAQQLDAVASDYERQCRLARTLAEEHFDARRVVARVLDRALA